MYCVVLPYCGRDAAREELEIPPPPRRPTGSGAPLPRYRGIKRTGTTPALDVESAPRG